MLPPILYKYRADGEFTQKIITDKKVWFSMPSDLNDPLECQTGIVPSDLKAKIVAQHEAAQIAGMFFGENETLFSLDRRQTRKWLKAFKAKSHLAKVTMMRTLYRNHGFSLSDPSKLFTTFEEQLAAVGIFSLSACGNNQLLWAHYGDSHKGLAFGFSTQRGGIEAAQSRLLEVKFSDEKPVLFDGLMVSPDVV